MSAVLRYEALDAPSSNSKGWRSSSAVTAVFNEWLV